MTNDRLKKLVSKAPTGPGIYIFAGPSRKKLYIGKASNIKARLSSYLKTADQRILQMLARARGIKTLETGSEIEALILESQYVKKYKPAFNIMLRDDKQFFYVVFTNLGVGSRALAGNSVEMFSKIFITHQPTPFGPFTDGTALKTTLRYLRKIFPYCTCKKPHNNFCLNYHIGKCYGICCLSQQSRIYNFQSRRFGRLPDRFASGFTIYNEYQKNIKAIKEVLSGKKNSLLKKLEKEMVALGKKEKFEEASELRNKLGKLKKVFENAHIIRNLPHYDTPSYHSGENSTLRNLQKVLGLKTTPRRIEGYDVANIQGKYAVGAMVVFLNGKPDKNEYRKFKIRNNLRLSSLDGAARIGLRKTLDVERHAPRYRSTFTDLGGDVGMLKEVLERRFNHPEWPMPDLILVDGGKAQLNAAHSVVKKIPIIALTKDKKHRGSKIYVSGRKSPAPLSQLPALFNNLLLQIDSEAHRFAISYYRRLHRRTIK